MKFNSGVGLLGVPLFLALSTQSMGQVIQYNSLTPAQRAQLDNAVTLSNNLIVPNPFGSTINSFVLGGTAHTITMSSNTNTPSRAYLTQVGIARSFDASLMCEDKALIRAEMLRGYPCGAFGGPNGTSFVPLRPGELLITNRSSSDFWSGSASGDLPSSYVGNVVAGYCPDIKPDLSNVKYATYIDTTTYNSCRVWLVPPFNAKIFSNTANYDPLNTQFQLCQRSSGNGSSSTTFCGSNAYQDIGFVPVCPTGYASRRNSSGTQMCELSCPLIPVKGIAGDMNCDRRLDTLDVQILTAYLNSPRTPNDLPRCGRVSVNPAILDVNGDGAVNQLDVEAMNNQIAGKCDGRIPPKVIIPGL